MRVLGIGSPFGDDRLGWLAIEQLARSARLSLLPPESVQLTVHDRPGTSLLAAWEDARRVILIDGVRSGAVPGTLVRVEGERLAVTAGGGVSSHAFGVAAAAALARSLGHDVSRIVLHGLEIDPVNQGDELSPAVQAAMPYLLRQVEADVLRVVRA